jgi:TATA-binding protein-associated factor
MEWITTPFLRLLFQNILLEKREDVRSLTLKTWNLALKRAITDPNSIHELIPIAIFRDWVETCTTPIGDAIDADRLFVLTYQNEITERHNIDKIMLSQDLSLIDENIVWLARVACAQCLAIFANILPREVGFLQH